MPIRFWFPIRGGLRLGARGSTMAKGKYGRLRSSKYSSTLFMLTVVLLVLLTFGIVSLPESGDDVDSPNDLSSVRRRIVERSAGLGKRENQWTEIISWEPRAFVYHNFLSKEECDYLIALATPHMTKSTVVDSKTGKSKDSRVRTSSGTFLRRGRDKVIRDIEKRIADFTFIPVEHGEGLQILHYEVGQKYDAHFDYFLDEYNTKNGGQRIATILMYLSDVEEGGETVFPSAKGNISDVPWWNELSECGKQGLSVKPKMGDALLFWSMRPDASLDPSSLHGGCPVIRGNKWSSTKWMHLEEYKERNREFISKQLADYKSLTIESTYNTYKLLLRHNQLNYQVRSCSSFLFDLLVSRKGSAHL